MKSFKAGFFTQFFSAVSLWSILFLALSSASSWAETEEELLDSIYNPYANKPLLTTKDHPLVECVGRNCPNEVQKKAAGAAPGRGSGSGAPPATPSCPVNTNLCTSKKPGASSCCESNQKCIQYGKDSAGCMPADPSACREGTTFCGPASNGDTTCCDLSKETCEINNFIGVAYCQANQCKKPNTKCSVKCCTPDQKCIGRACSQSQCKENETLCTGAFNICCPENTTCSPGINGGNPNCYANPTPTPEPTPDPTAKPTPTPAPPGPTPTPTPSPRPSASQSRGPR